MERLALFYATFSRAGVDSVPLVGLVCFFLGLTMALLTGYQSAGWLSSVSLSIWEAFVS